MAHFWSFLYHLFFYWQRSVRTISRTYQGFIFLSTSIAIYIALIVLDINNLTEAESIIINRLFASGAFMTFATTIISTFLIVYRIYLVSHQDFQSRSKYSFNTIIELAVQSAAVYAANAFVFAVAQLLVARPVVQLSFIVMEQYTLTLLSALSVSILILFRYYF